MYNVLCQPIPKVEQQKIMFRRTHYYENQQQRNNKQNAESQITE